MGGAVRRSCQEEVEVELLFDGVRLGEGGPLLSPTVSLDPLAPLGLDPLVTTSFAPESSYCRDRSSANW